MMRRFHEVNVTCPKCHAHRLLTDKLHVKCVCGYRPRTRKAGDWALLEQFGS